MNILKDLRSLTHCLIVNAGANTDNRPFHTVEPEKLDNKFYKNNLCTLLGAGA